MVRSTTAINNHFRKHEVGRAAINFSAKLDTLPGTVELIEAMDLSHLIDALASGSNQTAVAIGSGGSLISAHFFAACRSDMTAQATFVQTPMEFVLDERDLRGSQVWLFTGRGENADAHAAANAARAKGCSEIHIVTSNPTASIFDLIEQRSSAKHVLPVLEEKDGFLSTHSLFAVIAGLLQATHVHLNGADASNPLSDFSRELTARRSLKRIHEFGLAFQSVSPTDTMIVLADPRLRAAAVALETSLWEAALCPVQVSDFRNFAHGRHVWLHKRAASTFVLSMTGNQSRESWSEIERELPENLRRQAFAYGNVGRPAPGDRNS